MGVKKKSSTKGIRSPTQGISQQSGGSASTNQGRSQALKQQIWQVISMIPKGQVASYGQIAALIGYPSHARFVGATLRNLPKGSKLPWYRVVNSSLKISLQGGGKARQRRLLESEDITFIGDRIAKAHRWETET
jgi:methylated-DNA-protein-cysteine methyltransferase-like protein